LLGLMTAILVATTAGCSGAPGPTVSAPPTPTPVWSPASSADTALVDRLATVWTTHDVAAVPELYANDALFLDPLEQAHGDLAKIREGIATNSNTYVRVGAVNVATEPAPGGFKEIPEGSRYLVFPVTIHNDLFVVALEINREGKIAIQWLFALQTAP
jgi:hypothetical protein